MSLRGAFEPPSRRELGVALLAAVAAVAGSFAVSGLTRGFVVAPVNRLVTDYMPDPVVAFAIFVLGSLGQKVGLALAAGLTVLAFAVPTLVAYHAEGRYSRGAVAGALAGLLAGLLTGAPGTVLAAGLPVLATVLLATDQWGSVDAGDARRRVLRATASVAGFGLLGAALGGRRTPGPVFGEADPAVDSLLAEAEGKSLDVAGMEPLVSEGFYEVDINAINPTVDREDWTLSVTGAVPEETTFTFADLRDLGTEYRFETLRCVNDRINGEQMDTAVWTGVPVEAVFDGLSVPEECCVMLRAADGYFEEFPLAALREGMLAWGMNGRPLPRRHGHPVRALVPGHWGEINVKWLTEIQVLEREREGYWEERGWHGTGPVNTVAKLHAINHLEGGRVQVGGHAYAGTRGVERVEVSTDGGETWTEATLSEPLPGDDVWRQWKHEYDPPGNEHDVVVRAVDGTGAVQPREESQPFPSGATGWVSREVEP